MRYIIYCDESDDKGVFYSNFYGGAILAAKDKGDIEKELTKAKGEGFERSEFKWTKITPHNEERYVNFIDKIFDLLEKGKIKLRIMFTQNINHTNIEYEVGNKYFILYYHFIKHAFGLRYCNSGIDDIDISVYLDDVPNSREEFDNFRHYLSSLSEYPIFHSNNIMIAKSEITDVRSHDHVILQAVDVILGSIQFRLNDKHKEKPQGERFRGKRTRAKERVYKKINRRICVIYPHLNIGVSTAQANGAHDRWLHPYRHWLFTPTGSVRDLSRGKRRGE